MFGFFKKLLGLPTAEEKAANESAAAAPYKVEAKKTVDSQITDAVTAPAVKLPIDNPVEKPKKKQPAAKKAAAPKATKPRGRKPKAK